MSTAPEPLFLRIHSATYRFGVRWKGAEPLTVGRGGENRIVLSDDGISAHHLRLDRDADGIVVTDLNSRNGTRVGTVPLHGSTTIVPGQTIELARQVWLTPLRALASGAQKLGWALRLDQRPGLLPIPGGPRSLSDLIPASPSPRRSTSRRPTAAPPPARRGPGGQLRGCPHGGRVPAHLRSTGEPAHDAHPCGRGTGALATHGERRQHAAIGAAPFRVDRSLLLVSSGPSRDPAHAAGGPPPGSRTQPGLDLGR